MTSEGAEARDPRELRDEVDGGRRPRAWRNGRCRSAPSARSMKARPSVTPRNAGASCTIIGTGVMALATASKWSAISSRPPSCDGGASRIAAAPRAAACTASLRASWVSSVLQPMIARPGPGRGQHLARHRHALVERERRSLAAETERTDPRAAGVELVRDDRCDLAERHLAVDGERRDDHRIRAGECCWHGRQRGGAQLCRAANCVSRTTVSGPRSGVLRRRSSRSAARRPASTLLRETAPIGGRRRVVISVSSQVSSETSVGMRRSRRSSVRRTPMRI